MPVIRVNGNRMAVKIVRVLIVSFICIDRLAMYKSRVELIVSRKDSTRSISWYVSSYAIRR